jgi:hypothetical protein
MTGQSDDPAPGPARREGIAWREARHACPHPDLLLARRSDALEHAVRLALADHLAVCDACARLAADFDALGLDDPGDETVSRVRERVMSRVRRRAPPIVAWAAGIVLAAGAGLAWWWTQVPDVQPAPGEAPAPALRSGAPAVTALWTVTPPPVRLPLTALGPTRSGERADAVHAALVEALEGYRAGRFAESIAPLEGLARRHPESGDVAFYLGVSLLLSDRAAEALPVLDRARRTAEGPRAAEIDWYLATAEQRAGQSDRARPRLAALCGAAGPFSAAACAAAERLR